MLNTYEIDLVAGGWGTTGETLDGMLVDKDSEIVVTGRRSGIPGFGFSYGYAGPEVGGNYIDGGGGRAPDPKGGEGSAPPAEPEIVVNGIRQDPADRAEVLMEREWLVNGAILSTSGWVNAEYVNGGWTITSATAPTQDQKNFKSNYDKVHGALWSDLNNSQQASLASDLTDFGVDLAASRINIGYAYLHYRDLLESGAVQGSGSRDFAAWVAGGGR